jgi:hypothetical protein
MVQRFITQYQGSSFPTLIKTEGGHHYVLKMRGSGNGPVSLLSEYIANKTAHLLGWPVPDVYWVQIRENFPWTFGTDEFDDIVVKSYGWNLGIQYIEGAIAIPLNSVDFEAEQLLDKVYSLDLFFMNLDRTSMSSNFLKDPQGKIWVIDHGALLLFHAPSKSQSTLYQNHFFLEQYPTMAFDFNRTLLNPDLFINTLAQIPAQILTESGFTQEALFGLIQDRISALTELLGYRLGTVMNYHKP